MQSHLDRAYFKLSNCFDQCSPLALRRDFGHFSAYKHYTVRVRTQHIFYWIRFYKLNVHIINDTC